MYTSIYTFHQTSISNSISTIHFGWIYLDQVQQNLNSLSLCRHTLNIQYAFKVHLQTTLRIRYEMFRHENLLHQRSKCFEPKLKVHGTDEKM